MSNKHAVLGLYRAMLRSSSKIENYNFRSYAKRRVRDAFHAGKMEKDAGRVTALLYSARENQKLIDRQVLLGSMYRDQAVIIEMSEK